MTRGWIGKEPICSDSWLSGFQFLFTCQEELIDHVDFTVKQNKSSSKLSILI